MGEAEEMEAHSSQTSQKSLALELYLAIWLPFFFFPPPTSFFWISPPTPIPTLPTFFCSLSFVSLHYLALRAESTHQHPFYFRTLCACSSKKTEKKKKSLAASVNRLGRDMWKNGIRVHVRNMFLGNMLMCCSSACLSENNLLISHVLFVGAYTLTSAKCTASWFETTVFKSVEREWGDELDFLNWKQDKPLRPDGGMITIWHPQSMASKNAGKEIKLYFQSAESSRIMTN